MRKVEMLLETDGFIVTYDVSKGDDELLIKTVKKAGYTAEVVTGQSDKAEKEEIKVLTAQDFPVLEKALARAKAENKPIVLDFDAEWCVPCKQMEKEVFPDPKIAERLKKVIFVSIDTDKEPEMSAKLGVVGLPDIRFFSSNGRLLNKTVGLQTVESLSKRLDEVIK